MEFEDLPNEKIEEICENLDEKDLSKLMKTNWRINEACSRTLKGRQDDYLNELLPKLAGRWYYCGTNIDIKIFRTNLVIFQHIAFVTALEHDLTDLLLYPDMIHNDELPNEIG